jgi:predicted metal-dependent HD superfamily phosphohydrolase
MDEAEQSALRASWIRIAVLYGAHITVAEKLFATLANAYAEPGRSYHTLEHIAALLDDLEHFSSPSADRVALSFAAWFHDAIYDTHRSDNEKRSADFAANILRGLMAPEPVVTRVAELVLATKHHEADPADADALLFIDADLAILGAPADEYARYREAIRTEYAWVEPERFRAGRREVLERFLARESIYRTPAIRDRFEAAARENIATELAEIG